MSRQDEHLARWHAERQIGALGLHFARFLLEKAARPSQALALAAAWVCRAAEEGHVCLDLHRYAGQPLSPGGEQAPDLEEWRDQLLNSGVVGRPGEYQPLILDRADRLYLHRYWDYEQRVAKDLSLRAGQRPEPGDRARLGAGLRELFGDSGAQVDWQKLAAATASLRRLTVISGGPGTGKTTTVTKILTLLRMQPGGEALRIALAAPTGKAASRLQESVRTAKAGLALTTELAASIPERASTLHRLLGVRQAQPGFVHHADNPLPLDVLILDEASMVDVALMAKLLDALPENARLVLLGDKDQLASVEAGAVLGDLCGDCRGPSAGFAEELGEIAGAQEIAVAGAGGFCDSVVLLRRSYRFDEHSAIGRLALTVRQGEGAAACALLSRPDHASGLCHLSETQDVAQFAAERYRDYFALIKAGAAVETLFRAADRFRVLCALKQGPAGVVRMNRRITRYLHQAGLIVDDEWFLGRPVMVTRNDYQQGLYNGDVGIVLARPDKVDELAVAFPGEAQTVRWLAPSRLPPHETVFAMTVHKSQGSEFDSVLLNLPAEDTQLLSRELIYTAITRARSDFILAGPSAVFKTAVMRKLSRSSGLADALHDTDLF